MAEGTIAVLGGGRGIGAATARLAARRGLNVALLYAGNDAAAAGVVQEIEGFGRKALAIKGDISSEADIVAFYDAIWGHFGPVRQVANCAGIPGKIGRVETLEADMLRRVVEVNLIGTALSCREAVRRLSTRTGGPGGAIVNLSSMGATTGSPGELVHYAAAKGGVESFTLGLGREVAAEGIRVNSVSPGLIATEIHAEAGDADRIQNYATRMPMARVGQPEEVAEAIVWLLSSAASYITATILPVAGGR
jgi:NAD(P)-dependent dehydrogenase (short-subunit alcohol dehydrogenase family)